MSKLARLDDRALIRVSGPEARAFLNRLLSQEVETLVEGEARFAALLSPQGRVLHELFLHGEEDGVLVDAPAGNRDGLMARLRMFKLRAAVEIAADDRPVWALWDAASAPAPWRRDPRTPLAGWRLAGDPPASPGAEPGLYADHRLALGLPDAAADGLADKAYATELLHDLLAGVDYRKGCFVGQETTSRMKRRGGVRSRVLPLETDAPAGSEVLAGTLRAGEVTASHGGRALALLRLDRIGGALEADGRPARVMRPPWWPDGEPPFAEDGAIRHEAETGTA